MKKIRGFFGLTLTILFVTLTGILLLLLPYLYLDANTLFCQSDFPMLAFIGGTFTLISLLAGILSVGFLFLGCFSLFRLPQVKKAKVKKDVAKHFILRGVVGLILSVIFLLGLSSLVSFIGLCPTGFGFPNLPY